MNKTIKNFIFWIALAAVAYILPVTAFYVVFAHDHAKCLKDENKKLKNAADSGTQYLQYAFNNRKFWCFQLNKAFSEAKSPTELEDKLLALKSENNQDFQWVIWDKNNNVLRNTVKWEVSEKDWVKAGKLLLLSKLGDDFKIDKKEDAFLRSLFGPHFESKAILRPTYKSDPDLIELNLFENGESLWANFKDDYYAVAVFPSDIERKAHGLQPFLELFDHKEQRIIITQEDFFFSSDPKISKSDADKIKKYFVTKAPGILEGESDLYTARFAENDLFFCLIQKRLDRDAPKKQTILFAYVLGFLCLLFAHDIISGNISPVFGVKYVIVGLIGCANVFPLLLMTILSLQYLEQKKIVLIEEKRIEALNFLKRLENEFHEETNRIKNFSIKHINDLSKKLRKEPLTAENSYEFRKIMANVSGKFMVVASTTYPAVSDVAFLGLDESYIFPDAGTARFANMPYTSDNRLKLNDTLCKCGAAFIGFYNNVSIPDKLLMEVEIISDVVFQSSLSETYYKFLRLFDYVEKIGIGTEKHPTFMHFLSFNEKKMADYIFMFYFNLKAHAENFLEKNRTVLQANMQGIKVVYATGHDFNNIKIQPFTEEAKLRDYFARLTYQPPTSANFIELNNETWLSTGYVNKGLADIGIMALSRTTDIDRLLAGEKKQLFMLIFISAILVLGIALLFVKTLLNPVYKLQDATIAIKRRNFSHRIGDMGDDEFGQMSKVIDAALKDLEEMSVARAVQQQLFPKQQVYTGDYDVFSQSITMADLGGDYLDIFQLTESKFIMVLGDVAGHGVGAALIMAMAKSVMLNSEDLLDKPTELLARLHDIIYRTKTKKQRKIMTFQYVMVDSEAHKVTFANAGGCNPFLIKKDKTSQEVAVPGPALGSFKKSRFSQAEINLNPGDTLILYTDGFVESKNDFGEEMGFGGFEKMVADCRCEGSETYYNSIIAKNTEWRGQQPRQDDYSLMILQRR